MLTRFLLMMAAGWTLAAQPLPIRLDELVASGLIGRLEGLDLCRCGITDDGAQALAACPAVRKLKYLYLDNNLLSPVGLDAMADGLAYNILATVTKTAAAIAYAIPQVGSPFAMTYGGIQVGAALNAASSVFEIGSMIQSYVAQRSATMAGYERRAQDWELQNKLAVYDEVLTVELIEAAALRVEMARQDLAVTERQLAQTDEVTAFLQKKFTSVTDAPQTTAAPRATRTPSFPRPARCGLDELAPRAHTIAEMMRASTASTSPTVIEAPTMFLS